MIRVYVYNRKKGYCHDVVIFGTSRGVTRVHRASDARGTFAAGEERRPATSPTSCRDGNNDGGGDSDDSHEQRRIRSSTRPEPVCGRGRRRLRQHAGRAPTGYNNTRGRRASIFSVFVITTRASRTRENTDTSGINNNNNYY